MALQKLSDEWSVIHSVNWLGDKGDAQGDGEADFVIVHPSVGLIVLEVKGGEVAVGDGGWFSIDRKGKKHAIKDPVEQAMVSKKTLVEYVKDGLGSDEFVPASHAIALPDAPRAVGLGPNAPAEIVMSRAELSNPESFLLGVAKRAEEAPISEDTTETITRVLAPTVEVRRREREDVAEVTARIASWTEEQLAYLDDLAENNRQLILGGAGTGKTVLAKEKARALAAEGNQVLLTCFNKPLAEAIRLELDGVPGVVVDTFHGLVFDLARRARDVARVDETYRYVFPEQPTDEFWQRESADLLVRAAGALGVGFDAVVVDEGQDFSPEWFLALEFMLTDPETSQFYVFADRNQNVYRDAWEPPFEGRTFRLRRNCRNTNPIAERVAALGDTEMSAMGVHGPDPEFLEAESDEEISTHVRRTLHQLINQGGLDPSQVVVLCQHKADAERIRNETPAGQKLVRLGVATEGVVTETIHRFKGLEADACIVVLRDMSRARERALAYVGTSRARARLVVIGPRELRRQMDW